ncbi:MAG TPA: protein kinase [Kofleriaceae bacterium]|jgi:serine/threonine-protein kinase
MEAEAELVQIGDYKIGKALPACRSELAYEGTHIVLPRRARLTVMHPRFTGVRPVAVRIVREACILEAISHPGVPRVFECGVIDRRPWIATELVCEPTLGDELAERALSVSAVITLLRDAAEVLAAAHRRGVVHRALTPDAIQRTPNRSFPICMTGWGDAAVGEGALPQFVADDARHYRAPELARGGAELADGRADVYALGAIAHEALTLALPIVSVPRYMGIPAEISRLLERMLAPDPVARPSAAEVRAEAMRMAELGDAVDQVDVELVDISHADPDPAAWESSAPRPTVVGMAPISPVTPVTPLAPPRVRWTPSPGVDRTPVETPLAAFEISRRH